MFKSRWIIYRFPKMVEKQKATENPENNDRKCFQHAITAALNYEQIKSPQKEYQKWSLLLINTIGKK